jgi:endonuclease YncB( thermonuclease family)
MRAFSLIALAVFSLAALTALPALADITGRARAIDGDTLEIAGRRIVLRGIDAPELEQTCRTRKGKVQLCGELAKQTLQHLVRRLEITCKGDRNDQLGRLIAVCSLGPFNLNEQMVAEGWALADRDSGQDYARAERFAKARKEGIWRSEFVPPWEWRKGAR